MKYFASITFASCCILCLGCRSPEHVQTRLDGWGAAERDILCFAKEHPAGYSYRDRQIEYGDPNMEEAAKVLADIPHPWTVQKLIALFSQERDAYRKRLYYARAKGMNTMWEGSEQESRHCGCLATVLAASRDSRAAAVLGQTLEMPDCPDGYKVVEGVFDYFLEDPRYRVIHRYAPEGEGYTNFLPIMGERVRTWWFLKQKEVLASMQSLCSPR